MLPYGTKIYWKKPRKNISKTKISGTEMLAYPLGPDHPLGKDTHGKGMGDPYYAQQNFKKLTGSGIAGHLLNDHLGGPATIYNLAPFTSSTNSLHSHRIEETLKTIVDKKHGWVWYYVNADNWKPLSGYNNQHKLATRIKIIEDAKSLLKKANKTKKAEKEKILKKLIEELQTKKKITEKQLTNTSKSDLNAFAEESINIGFGGATEYFDYQYLSKVIVKYGTINFNPPNNIISSKVLGEVTITMKDPSIGPVGSSVPLGDAKEPDYTSNPLTTSDPMQLDKPTKEDKDLIYILEASIISNKTIEDMEKLSYKNDLSTKIFELSTELTKTESIFSDKKKDRTKKRKREYTSIIEQLSMSKELKDKLNENKIKNEFFVEIKKILQDDNVKSKIRLELTDVINRMKKNKTKKRKILKKETSEKVSSEIIKLYNPGQKDKVTTAVNNMLDKINFTQPHNMPFDVSEKLTLLNYIKMCCDNTTGKDTVIEYLNRNESYRNKLPQIMVDLQNELKIKKDTP